jgi:aquaporin Z
LPFLPNLLRKKWTSSGISPGRSRSGGGSTSSSTSSANSLAVWLAPSPQPEYFQTLATHPSVNYVITAPGAPGSFIAFVAEVAITLILMTVILHVSNNLRLHKFTGLCAGILVAAYITIEAPLSGMSMNPARTLASAVPEQHWTALWIYFTAPLIGMLSAAERYLRTNGARSIGCAKLHHDNLKRCIFCGKPEAQGQS